MATIWELLTLVNSHDQLDLMQDEFDRSGIQPPIESPLFHIPYHLSDILDTYGDDYEAGQEVGPNSALFVHDISKLGDLDADQIPSYLFVGDLKASGVPFSWLKRMLTSKVTLLGFNMASAETVCQLLSDLPQNSTLRHLYASGPFEVSEPDSAARHQQLLQLFQLLLKALQTTQCKVDGIVLDCFHTDACVVVAGSLVELGLHRKIKTLGLWARDGDLDDAERHALAKHLAEALTMPDTKLSELTLNHKMSEALSLEDLGAALSNIKRPSKLTRVDFTGSRALQPLMDESLKMQPALRDLGLWWPSLGTMHIMLTALQRPELATKVQNLHLHMGVFDKNYAECLVQALKSRECKLQMLDLHMPMHIVDGEKAADAFRCLWQVLLHQKASGSNQIQFLRLSCIRERSRPLASELMKSEFPEFIHSSDCPLLWLDFTADFTKDEEWKVATALSNNYNICNMFIPWTNPEARARAASTLRRNRLYRSGGLLQQEMVKPLTAKLFICGHGEVGKTTIRKRLLMTPLTRPLIWCSQYMNEARTRGMELHSLKFRAGREKLVICDLAGQQEYHIFHHYFVSGSDMDLFLVVCKYADNSSLEIVENQLEYWLRFIISHRSTDNAAVKPKVMVVINFFSHVQDKLGVAKELTEQLIEQYSQELDFGPPHARNVFGIRATKDSQVIALRRKLKDLFYTLLQTRPPIPKICYDVLQDTLPTVTSNRKSALFVKYSELFDLHFSNVHAEQQLADQSQRSNLFQAALRELHNGGHIVYFPIASGDQIVITDSGWFCNKLIGSLLAPQEFIHRSNIPSEWAELDIKKKLRELNCEEHLDDILIYLQRLELCFEAGQQSHDGSGRVQKKFLFPALVKEKSISWPDVVAQQGHIFYGRRLKCRDTAKQLIPSGVFSRLQVKLQDWGDNASYRLGYHWLSFVKDVVGVVVRFGGGGGEEPGGSSCITWKNHQCIDILVFYPDNSHDAKGEHIMGQIKDVVYDICQGATDFRATPTVLLEECALSEQGPAIFLQLVVSLAHMQKTILERGMGTSVCWDGTQLTVKVVDVLLPSELKQHVTQQLGMIEDIRMEFAAVEGSADAGSSSAAEEDVSGLNSESLVKLWHLIKTKLERMDERGEARFHILSELLKDIKSNTESLMRSFQEIERQIISKCSTHLVMQLLKGPLPLYPYLTDAADGSHGLQGKLLQLKSLLTPGTTARLHFFCESPTHEPHPVPNQKDIEVVLDRPDWLSRIAPLLVPALRVLCCVARLGATVYLPGSQGLIPSSSAHLLQSLGINSHDLQSKILQKALDALMEGHDDSSSRQQRLQHGQVQDVMQYLLRGKDINMARDFLLCRVEFKDRISWVCAEHCSGGERLKDLANPFFE